MNTTRLSDMLTSTPAWQYHTNSLRYVTTSYRDRQDQLNRAVQQRAMKKTPKKEMTREELDEQIYNANKRHKQNEGLSNPYTGVIYNYAERARRIIDDYPMLNPLDTVINDEDR